MPLATAQARELLEDREVPATDEFLRADVQTATVWLGKTAYIKQLVAEGVRFPQPLDTRSMDSVYCEIPMGSIFEHPIQAATIRGDVEMIKIILGALEEPQEANEENAGGGLIFDALKHHRREFFEFALGTGMHAPCVHAIERWLSRIPWPDMYERALAIVERHKGCVFKNRGLAGDHFYPGAEMVRYFVRKTDPTTDMYGERKCMLVVEISFFAMAKPERVLRVSGSYHRKPGISEQEFHDFLSHRHGVECAKVHEKYGILKYQMAFNTTATRGLLESMKLPYTSSTHDMEIEYYFKEVASLLAVSADEDFKALHIECEPFTWRNGKLVNVDAAGKNMQPSFAELSDIKVSDKPVDKYY
ncbi:hypothetical protein PG994_006895 [Apiospora phragmitis]|uniref:EthD domain-containing protein n=1 Tax=Apiospora phragmitis TaxID=2905665 RepID=A0ABR1VK14_9PEZI